MDAIAPHLQQLKDMGSTHVVYADTSLGRHGAIWGPISERPRLGADEWPAYGRKLTALAERFAILARRSACSTTPAIRPFQAATPCSWSRTT